MKLDIAIADHLSEKITVEGPTYSPQLAQVVDFVKDLDRAHAPLQVKKGAEIHFVDLSDIFRLVIENRVLHIKTRAENFTSSQRLYQVKEQLTKDFLQISQSEIIHLAHLDYLELTPNGLVKLVLKNKDTTYSSRRYLQTIKEALSL